MKRNEIISVYHKALENNNYFERKTLFIKKIKMFFYYIVIILLNDYTEDACDRVHVINGKMERKFIKNKEYKSLYYGFFKENSLRGVRKTFTLVSNCKKPDRIKILIRAIKSYRMINRGNLAYWIDFCFLHNFISSSGIKILLSNGHYDRLTSASSFLCEGYNVGFYIQQHGLIGKTQDIPCKLYCNKLYAFDEVEIKKFREKVIRNGDCAYEIKKVSNTAFTESPKSGFTIGVIEQPISEMVEIIRLTIELNPAYRVIIMMHPHSRIDFYKEFRGNKNIQFSYGKREWNLDLLVSSPSTLAYEYLQNGFRAPIFFVDINNVMTDFKGRYDNLIYIDNMEILRKELCNNIDNRIKETSESGKRYVFN